MAYIGKTPQVGNYQKCDALNASATADYTLQVSSTNVVPESVNHMIVSLNGVIQEPGATGGFTVSGSTLSFASALTANDTIDFVILLGNVLDIGTPSDDTVSTAKIQDDAVTSAKLGTGDMTFPNGDLIFGTAGKGVCLGVTSNTDSNTLDDYEEGTWTPQDTDGGGSSQLGMYTKIGNLVTCYFYLTTGAISGSNTFYITNLPFTAGSTDAFRGPVSISYTDATTMPLAGNAVNNDTTAYLLIGTGDIATDDEIGSSSRIGGSIIYRV